MLASVGQPSLHGYYACMVFWDKGALWRNCRLKNVRPPFLLFLFFLCSWYSLKGGGRRFFGCYGLEGLVTLVLFLGLCLLRFLMWVVGLLMGSGT